MTTSKTTRSLRLAIIGASGHGRVICDAVERSLRAHVVGFLDSGKEAGTGCLGLSVLGRVEDIAELARKHGFAACVLALGDNAVRRSCEQRIRTAWPGVRFATVVHPSAIVAGGVEVGEGSVILAGAIVSPGCRIGAHCILNTGSQLDHDSVMGDFSSLGPKAVTGGNVIIGTGTSVCIGASIIHGIAIGRETVVGAGAVVVRDIPDLAVAFGVPARVVRTRKAGERYL